MCPTDYPVMDHGAVYTGKEMRYFVRAHEIKFYEDSVETFGAIENVERYPAPLQITYKRKRASAGSYTSYQKRFDISLFAIKYTIGHGRL